MDMGFSKNIGLGSARPANPSRNLFIEAGLLAVVCVLFAWFIILPKKAEVAQKQEGLAKLQSQEDKVKSDLAKLQALAKNLEDNNDQTDLLDKALPLSLNMPLIEATLANMANSVNVTLGNISLSSKPNSVAAGDKELLADPYKPARTLQKATGNLYVVGDFNQLRAFIEKLEKSGRLINISELQMDSASENQLNLRISVSIYYFGT